MAAKKKKTASKKNADKGCDCAAKVDKALAPRNGRLLQALSTKSAPRRVYLAVERFDSTDKQKPPLLAANYCPFCGKKAPE